MASREEDDRYCSVEASTVNIPDEIQPPNNIQTDTHVVTIDMKNSKHGAETAAGSSSSGFRSAANNINVDGAGPSRKMESLETRIGEASITNEELVTTEEVLTIRELALNQGASLTGVLMYCKHRLLYPYLRFLGIMGLKPTLTPESSDVGICNTILNRAYFSIVLALLLTGYILQYMTCFRRDRGFVYKDEEDTPRDNGSDAISWLEEVDFTSRLFESVCGGNPFLIHVVPSLCHLFSFLYMVYLYRINEDEQLQNLMERVFIQTAHTTFIAQKRLLRTMQCLFVSSFLWIIVSVACQVVQILTHRITFNFQLTQDVQIGMITILALSTTWQDAIQLTVIISYSVHCILLSTYFELLYSRVQQHTITLSECIKEIGEFEKLVRYLNNDLSPGLGPLLILDSATAVSSIAFLALKGDDRSIPIADFISVIALTALWVCLTLFPLLQAARLAIACKKVREMGHAVRLRPFGYQEIPQSDLDSFLLFVSTLRIDVRILKMPISPQTLAVLFSFLGFFALVWGFFLASLITLPTMA